MFDRNRDRDCHIDEMPNVRLKTETSTSLGHFSKVNELVKAALINNILAQEYYVSVRELRCVDVRDWLSSEPNWL